MKRLSLALLLCGATLSTTTMSASAYDLDFPNQLRAIKVCYTQWSTEHPGKAITDAHLVACMKAQGFRFDPNRQIKGVGPCQGKSAADHPDCYAAPPETRASRTKDATLGTVMWTADSISSSRGAGERTITNVGLFARVAITATMPSSSASWRFPIRQC
jgi:hypothetical protein